ncbi:MAG: hypothetical protein ACK5XN_32895, partial [Bacteroidota bacterium]
MTKRKGIPKNFNLIVKLNYYIFEFKHRLSLHKDAGKTSAKGVISFSLNTLKDIEKKDMADAYIKILGRLFQSNLSTEEELFYRRLHLFIVGVFANFKACTSQQSEFNTIFNLDVRNKRVNITDEQRRNFMRHYMLLKINKLEEIAEYIASGQTDEFTTNVETTFLSNLNLNQLSFSLVRSIDDKLATTANNIVKLCQILNTVGAEIVYKEYVSIDARKVITNQEFGDLQPIKIPLTSFGVDQVSIKLITMKDVNGLLKPLLDEISKLFVSLNLTKDDMIEIKSAKSILYINPRTVGNDDISKLQVYADLYKLYYNEDFNQTFTETIKRLRATYEVNELNRRMLDFLKVKAHSSKKCLQHYLVKTLLQDQGI